ncbi:Ser/Thr protein phosphatase, putative [Trichomonas vaginalis G3]|uniref:Serine/threonine-protein phosphatase n=1 Tax=Trichomonas vaginalis (strain ATCC PRA-98 / G3) TaxID=412133 RepID=A2DT90_TRIV3|nr:phosphoprotein phosphatase protein [Trichomonas vaginalis G3]EAY16362.1 Ser/Thr protein phosphatase, putative [Trichomonas vaginalis G3]KAI5488408.1 phosphoprotein phosphatase protein [Trichomonas vaginalis G3]|eukprot:XP_001328585.1 Ser/Thr protein phosphatase [Trichomonas vaginalis G3]
MKTESTSVDSIFYNTLLSRVNKDEKIQNYVSETEIQFILNEVSKIFQEESILLEIPAKLHVVGDLHGNVNDLVRIFQKVGYPPEQKYLFLGDYIDRGDYSIEVLLILFCLKIKFPSHVYMLRGNHEIVSMSSYYGFKDEIESKYNLKMFHEFHKVFKLLPLACLIQKKIFCVHGGLSPSFKSFKHLKSLDKPGDLDRPSMFLDFVWSDPKDQDEKYTPSKRRSGKYFNQKALNAFLRKTGVELVLRAHEFSPHGYDFPYKKTDACITVFSTSNYCGRNNKAAIINVSPTLEVTLTSFDPTNGEQPIIVFPQWVDYLMVQCVKDTKDSISEPISEVDVSKSKGTTLEVTQNKLPCDLLF